MARPVVAYVHVHCVHMVYALAIKANYQYDENPVTRLRLLRSVPIKSYLTCKSDNFSPLTTPHI
ncbi:hypothetical protein BCEP27_160077 [Burkholderia cepacia]